MKTVRLFLLIVIASLLLTACAPQTQPTTAVSGPLPLTGSVTRADVESAEGWQTLRGEDYSPDAALVKTIAENSADVKVLLFLGTWCGDSKREVPRFFKLMDQTGIAASQVEIIALDRTKKDANGLTEKWNIQYVPTFIFLRGDEELGRIVETPAGSLDANIAEILTGGA